MPPRNSIPNAKSAPPIGRRWKRIAIIAVERRLAAVEIHRRYRSRRARQACACILWPGESQHSVASGRIRGENNFSEVDVDAHLNNVAKTQGVPIETLAPLRGMLVGGIVKAQDETARNAWARNQTYIALGNLLTSAALLGIDACPMEGFDRAQYDEILGLKAKGFAAAVIATLGYRSPADKYATVPKVRFPKEQIFVQV